MLQVDTCLVSKKFYKSPLTNYDFGVAIGALLLKLQNFKKVKLIFGRPVPSQVLCILLYHWVFHLSVSDIPNPDPNHQSHIASNRLLNHR